MSRLPGIIPACAGNTARSVMRTRCRRNHPRMRGEHQQKPYAAIGSQGSSPHARGTRHDQRRDHHRRRIIPACAGNTSPGSWCSCSSRDHPRMRGEHAGFELLLVAAQESSPHARGTPLRDAEDRVVGGIIPACAGNTARGNRPDRVTGDHPRMRGEHAFP